MLLLLIVYLIFSYRIYANMCYLYFYYVFLFLQMSKLYLVENMFTIYFVGKSMLEDDT